MIAVFALLQVAVAFLTYEQTLTFDEAMWQYIGRNWFRNGLTPYSGGIDNKSPLIFWVFGLSDKFFGVNYWFPRLLGICFQCGGLYFVYKIANHFSGNRAGMIASIIYGLSLTWHATGGKYVSYTETYEVAFIIAAFYYAVTGKKDKYIFIGGILAGTGFLFRISAFFGVLAILISLLLNKKKQALAFLCGVLASVVFIIALLSFSGIALPDLFNYAFLDNFGPGSVTDHTVFWKANNFFSQIFSSELVLFLPGLVAYFFIGKRNNIFIVWFVSELIAITAIGTYSPQHFKEILPVLSLINALSIAYIIEAYKIPARQTMIMLWICFFPKLLEPVIGLKKLIFGPGKHDNVYNTSLTPHEDDYAKKTLGLWIRSNTEPDTRIVVAGNGAIVQAYSERISSSNYFNSTETKAAKEKFFREVSSNKPGLVFVPNAPGYRAITDTDITGFIDRLVVNNYYVDRMLYGYTVYRVKNSNGSY
jgi:hypothetical protein